MLLLLLLAAGPWPLSVYGSVAKYKPATAANMQNSSSLSQISHVALCFYSFVFTSFSNQQVHSVKLPSYYSQFALCNNDHHNHNTVRRILSTQSNVRHATCIGDRGCLGGERALAHPDRLPSHEHDSDSESSFGSNQVIKLIIPSLHCGTSCTTWRPARCSSSSTLRLNTQLETPSWMQ